MKAVSIPVFTAKITAKPPAQAKTDTAGHSRHSRKEYKKWLMKLKWIEPLFCFDVDKSFNCFCLVTKYVVTFEKLFLLKFLKKSADANIIMRFAYSKRKDPELVLYKFVNNEVMLYSICFFPKAELRWLNHELVL